MAEFPPEVLQVTKMKKTPILTEDVVCKKCGFPILPGMKLMKHADGTVFCLDCFNKLVKQGKIK